MDEFISKLQKKPEHHRRHITFATSAGITALVFMLWVTVVAPRSIQNEVVAEAPTKSRTDVESPIGTIKQSTAAVYDGIKKIFIKSNDSISNINIDTEYGKVKTQVQNGDIKLMPSPSAQ